MKYAQKCVEVVFVVKYERSLTSDHMSVRLIKHPILASISLAVLLSAGLAATSALSAGPTVSAEDLVDAGFTDVKVQAPSGSGFLAPTAYFRVKETVAAAHPEWGDAANLVAALIFPMNYQTTFSLAEPRLRDFSGRADACMTRPGYYICVTGPDAGKVRALLDILMKK